MEIDVTPKMPPSEYTHAWVEAVCERMDMRAAGNPDWLRVGPLGAKVLKEQARRTITALRSRKRPMLP